MRVRRTLEWFIEKSKKVHGDKYDYSKSVFKTVDDPICITCSIHGDFMQRPQNHYGYGYGCHKCYLDRVKSDKYLSVLYSRWRGIKGRCYNKKNSNYAGYGGRGIVLSDEFFDYEVFKSYIESLDGYVLGLGKDKEIDRIDNDGNYERGNIRITTRQVQNINKRHAENKTAGYRGLYRNKDNIIKVSVSIFGRQKHLKSCRKINDAVALRNKYIIENNLPHQIQVVDVYSA